MEIVAPDGDSGMDSVLPVVIMAWQLTNDSLKLLKSKRLVVQP